MKRRTKNIIDVCFNCFCKLKIENRTKYMFQIRENNNRKYFCSSKCQKEYEERKKTEILLGIYDDKN